MIKWHWGHPILAAYFKISFYLTYTNTHPFFLSYTVHTFCLYLCLSFSLSLFLFQYLHLPPPTPLSSSTSLSHSLSHTHSLLLSVSLSFSLSLTQYFCENKKEWEKENVQNITSSVWYTEEEPTNLLFVNSSKIEVENRGGDVEAGAKDLCNFCSLQKYFHLSLLLLHTSTTTHTLHRYLIEMEWALVI